MRKPTQNWRAGCPVVSVFFGALGPREIHHLHMMIGLLLNATSWCKVCCLPIPQLLPPLPAWRQHDRDFDGAAKNLLVSGGRGLLVPPGLPTLSFPISTICITPGVASRRSITICSTACDRLEVALAW